MRGEELAVRDSRGDRYLPGCGFFRHHDRGRRPHRSIHSPRRGSWHIRMIWYEPYNPAACLWFSRKAITSILVRIVPLGKQAVNRLPFVSARIAKAYLPCGYLSVANQR